MNGSDGLIRARVKALINVTDYLTGEVHLAGSEFVIERTRAELNEAMRQTFWVVLDGRESPAIVVDEVGNDVDANVRREM